jgi:hypothetical protein
MRSRGAQLVIDLVNGEGIRDAGKLLLTGGAIWLTNVIVFSFWYWLFDRGGPYARLDADDPFPAFTNTLAFSPTDVMPLKHWAKLTMLLQSLVSVMIAGLVIARAVNTFH